MPLMFVIVVAALMLALAGALCIGLSRSVLRAWVEHRVRLRLLEHFERSPELFRSPDDVQAVLVGTRENAYSEISYTATGVMLALIGVGCIVAGHVLRVGQLAVGVHVGGWICVVLGLALAIAGLVINVFVRNRFAAVARG